jgi:DNA polymerase (family 10)
MDKSEVAAILDEIGTLLEIQGENSFRCNAYHNAARVIGQLGSNLSDVVAAGKLGDIPGIGDTMKEKITTLVTTGKLPYYEDLRKKTPEGLLKMLKIPGMGPKKVKALHDQLGIDTLDKLKSACEAGEVAKLKGFGAKTQDKILEGIEFLGTVGNRVRLDQAMSLAEGLLEGLRKCKGIVRMEVCGSLRRRRETNKDIDILVSSDNAGPIMDAFVKLPGVMQVIAHGDTKSSVVVAEGQGADRVVMNADLRIIRDEHFPFALHYFTGSKAHNIAMRARAIKYGLKLSEYELAGPQKSVKAKDEADIFRALDLDYIPPELREDTGELQAAEEHRLPTLLEPDDLQGTFHCHTDWSDGKATLLQMVEAAKKMGFKYFGIGDHSQSLSVANGLTPDRVRKQQEAIDALNTKIKGIRVFKGTECDILPDGRLDYDDKLLATFDYVVASVHSHFNLPEAEMTARIIKAISHPAVTMLGHATGRLLLRRDGYKVDVEAILKAAAKHGTMVEINAQPMRLDLDWIYCKKARELGVPIVINPDAHSTEELDYMKFGVFVARRGWLEKKDVFNTQTAAQVSKALAARKK